MANWWDEGVGALKELIGLPETAVKCCTSAQMIDEPPSGRGSTAGWMGVGMLLADCENPTYNNHNVAVQSLSAGGPADNSKQIQPGDVLLKIDGRDLVGLRKSDLGDLLLGPVGSAASLTLKRGPAWKGGEGKTYSVDLNRNWSPAGLKDVPSGL